MFTMHDEITRSKRQEEIEMLGDGFFVTSSDEYIPNNIISYHNNIFHYTTLHSSFGHFDDLDTRELVELDEFLNRFDEFCIDRYCLL